MKVFTKGKTLFPLLLLIIVTAFLISSWNLPGRAKTVPFAVSGFTIALLLIILLSEIFPRFARVFKVGGVLEAQKQTVKAASGEAKERADRRPFFIVMAWLIIYMIMIFLIGFIVATGLAMLSFFKIYGKLSWVKALIYSAILVAILYVLFEVLFNFHLFRGILTGDMLM